MRTIRQSRLVHVDGRTVVLKWAGQLVVTSLAGAASTERFDSLPAARRGYEQALERFVRRGFADPQAVPSRAMDIPCLGPGAARGAFGRWLQHAAVGPVGLRRGPDIRLVGVPVATYRASSSPLPALDIARPDGEPDWDVWRVPAMRGIGMEEFLWEQRCGYPAYHADRGQVHRVRLAGGALVALLGHAHACALFEVDELRPQPLSV